MNELSKKFLGIFKEDLIFFAFLLIYGSLIIHLSYVINIWEDEAYTLNTTSHNLKEVIFESYNFEGQPPAYFVLLAIWRLINPSIFFARLFSIILIWSAAFIFIRLVRLISGFNNSKWLLIVFLLNPFAVWAALEIRSYALLIFISTISLHFFIRYIYYQRRRDLYYFLATCLIGVYTQYFFVFLITTLALSLLIFRGWKAFLHLSLYLLPVLILVLPNLLFIKDNIDMAYSDNIDYTFIQRISLASKSAQNIILAIDILSHQKILRWIVRILFIISFLVAYIRLLKISQNLINSNLKKFHALLVSLLILITLYTIYLLITGIKFNDRYMAIAFPMLILLFIIFKEYNFFFRNFVFSTISIYFIILLIVRYSNPIKTYDYQYLSNYIDKTAYPNEPILFNSRTVSIPFDYYYSYESNPLIPLPDTSKLTKAGFQVLITDTIQIERLIKYGLLNSKSILFINDNLIGYSSKFNLTSQMIDQCLNSHFNISLDTMHYGRSEHLALRIRRLTDKSL